MITTYVLVENGKYCDVCPSITDAFTQHARTSRTLRDQLAARTIVDTALTLLYRR